MQGDLRAELDEAREEIADLNSELDNARDEIDTLQYEIESLESQLDDRYDEGYNQALEDIKAHAEEIER